jgi:hypothetical protein
VRAGRCFSDCRATCCPKGCGDPDNHYESPSLGSKMNSVASRLFERTAALGFAPVSDGITFHKLDRWFVRQNGKSPYETFVSFEYKPKAHGMAISFGISYPPARAQIRSTVDSLRQSVQIPFGLDPGYFQNAPCWTMFSAGRFFSWPMLMIELSDHACMTRFEEFAQAILNDICLGVDEDQKFAKFLSRDEPPFEWEFGFPLLRFCDLILALRRCGHDLARVDSLPAIRPELPVAEIAALLLSGD